MRIQADLQIRHTAFPFGIINFFVLERLTLDLWIPRMHSGFAVLCLLALTRTEDFDITQT